MAEQRMNEQELQIATAYHEAGHAVVALALGRPVELVSVKANQLRLGRCELRKSGRGRARDQSEAELLILLGGVVAEARLTGDYAWDGAQLDLREARSIINARAHSERQARRMERRLLDRTEHLMDQPGAWEAVERIAAELLKSQTISGRAARHYFELAAAAAERHG